jgi:hypothetical protein
MNAVCAECGGFVGGVVLQLLRRTGAEVAEDGDKTQSAESEYHQKDLHDFLLCVERYNNYGAGSVSDQKKTVFSMAYLCMQKTVKVFSVLP